MTKQKLEEVQLKLNSALFFLSKDDYKRSLEDLKTVGDIILEARNKGVRAKQKAEFERKNVKLPLI